jgi:phage terminase small subunit
MAKAKIPPRRKMNKRQANLEVTGDDGLTDKQRVFVEQYLTCWNASEAARRAGYSEKSAGSIGFENMKKPEIRAVIDQRLTDYQMGADEVIARLSALATADMADFLVPSGRGVRIDLKRAKTLGKLHVIRKYTKTDTGTTLELYDVKDALVQLGRHHALFTDNIAGNLNVARRNKSADEMSDDELAAIAATSNRPSGGAGTA